MFTTIIIGVDGAAGGEDAVALAKRLASPSSTLIAASVAIVEGHPTHGANRDFDHRAVQEAQDRLERVLEAHPELEGEVLVAASVGHGLHAAAERHDAGLLVVGSCRRGPVGRVFAGDDARGTVRDASCPVAVAPTGFAEHPRPIDVVGLGWDGSPQSEAALDVARAIAEAAHGHVRALEVVGLPLWPVPEASMAGRDVARQVAEANVTVGALEGVEGHAVSGLAVDELTRFAADVGVLVVGSRQRGPLGRVVIGSTSEGLTRRCPTPLVVVPRTRQPAVTGS